MRQTDSEIIEIDEQIEDEINKGIIPAPGSVDPITGEPLPGGDPMAMGADGMGMGEVPMEPDMGQDAAVADAQMQKDTKKAEI